MLYNVYSCDIQYVEYTSTYVTNLNNIKLQIYYNINYDMKDLHKIFYDKQNQIHDILALRKHYTVVH